MSTKPDSKEVSVAKRQHKALMQSAYKELSEHGLSKQAKRYRDEYIRPKRRKDHDDTERVVPGDVAHHGGQDHSEGT